MGTSTRIYDAENAIIFAKTKERFGGLSNMAAGFSLFVNYNNILTSEALYQACKFPLFPNIQSEILAAKSPMTAKEISRHYKHFIRQDWHQEKYRIMEWCLRAKLVQNYTKFSELLLATGNLPIVEFSTKDSVWGAAPNEEGKLVGQNALGRLLMKLREEIKQTTPTYLRPFSIAGFLLCGRPIETIYPPEYYYPVETAQ